MTFSCGMAGSSEQEGAGGVLFAGTPVSLLRNSGSPAACLPSPPEILICVFVWDVWVSAERRCKTQTVSLWIRCATHSKSRHD